MTSGGNLAGLCAAWRSYVVAVGARPPSVASLAGYANLDLVDAYRVTTSLGAIEGAVVRQMAIEVISGDPDPSSATAREKVLTLAFNFFSDHEERRQCFRVLVSPPSVAAAIGIAPKVAPVTKDLAPPVASYVREALNVARHKGELPKRQLTNCLEVEAILRTFFGILLFWVHDVSPQGTATDALIEKSFGFLFDLIEKGPLDSGFDLGRFLFRTARERLSLAPTKAAVDHLEPSLQ